MSRIFPQALIAIILGIFLSANASATTYYVAANGSDSNNGTSKSSPWLHAPGMKNCTNVCGSAQINPGDSIIFRGGDAWHWGPSGNNPYIGTCTLTSNSCWNFTASGSASGCNLNASAGALTTSTCIYIGVDQTWFVGGSWTRPQFNGDNPITTRSPNSCLYEDSGYSAIYFRGSYLVIDNLEFLGYCWNVTSPFLAVVNIGPNDEIKNSYWHGWTMGTTATGCGGCDSDEYWALGPWNGDGSLSIYERIDHNVFDGSDSTFGDLPVGNGNATGAIFMIPGEIDHNVINHASNGMKYDVAILVHDNFFENMSEPVVGGTHGNIMEWRPIDYTVSTYYYNNLISNTYEGETVDMYPGASSSSKHGYIFNNIMWGIGNGGNCYMIEGDGAGGPGSIIFFNNTSDSSCTMRPLRGSSQAGIFQNNHFIAFPSAAISAFSGLINTDNGNEIFQSQSASKAQGYVPDNNYAPTSGSGATVGAGANLVSICNAMDNPMASAACKHGYGGVSYDSTNHVVADNPVVSRPSTGAWDAGAYSFGNAVSAPTGLSAIVN